MTAPMVDVVIPVHRAERSIDAAVASASSEEQGVRTRVTVVLHNLELEPSAMSHLAERANVLHCDDGIPSPSGPRNVGLDAASAPFVFFLDSDDQLAPACLRRLHEVASDTGADVVLPSLRQGDTYIGSPLVTARSVRLLDVTRHHLFLRSHVPALIRRSTMLSNGIRYPETIRTSEDLVVMSQLYVCARTAMAFDAVYVVIDAGDERASTATLPTCEQLAALRLILDSEWFDLLSSEHRQALVRRILAVNLAGSWRNRRRNETTSHSEYAAMRDRALMRSAASARFLSIRDRRTLRFETSPSMVSRLLTSKPFGLVPASMKAALSRRSPLLFELRSWVVRHRRRRVDLAAVHATRPPAGTR